VALTEKKYFFFSLFRGLGLGVAIRPVAVVGREHGPSLGVTTRAHQKLGH
jgi:diadenosine tetraphosphatase ApaH/serine/threonine PP2A family protein phosphatase